MSAVRSSETAGLGVLVPKVRPFEAAGPEVLVPKVRPFEVAGPEVLTFEVLASEAGVTSCSVMVCVEDIVDQIADI